MHYLNYRLSLLTLLAVSLATSQSFTMGDKGDIERKVKLSNQANSHIGAIFFIADSFERGVSVQRVTSGLTSSSLTNKLSGRILELLKTPNLTADFVRNTCLVTLTMLNDHEENNKSELLDAPSRQSTASSSSSPSLTPSSPSSFQSVHVTETISMVTSTGILELPYDFRTSLLDSSINDDEFRKSLIAAMNESLQNPDLTPDGLRDICGQGALLVTLHEKDHSSEKSKKIKPTS